MARIATLASLKKEEAEAGTTEVFAGGGGEGGSSTSMLLPRSGDADIDGVFSAGASSAAAPRSDSTRVEMFRNGFRVDGGEFRPTTGMEATDANRKFLRALANREVPRELEDKAGPDGDVPLAVSDRRGEDFDPATHGSGSRSDVAAAAKRERFGGAGRSMGGSSSSSSSSSSAAAAASSAAAMASTAAGAEEAAPTVDASLPTLTLAVRLASRKRARVTLNESHTVAQLIAHVATLSDCDGKPFTLHAGFPPKQLTDLSATLLEAGLKGAAVQQQVARAAAGRTSSSRSRHHQQLA